MIGIESPKRPGDAGHCGSDAAHSSDEVCPVQEGARPKLRGTTEAFASRLLGSHVPKTNAPESLVIASFVRGLSMRDVEAALAEALGEQAAVSKSTVSRSAGPSGRGTKPGHGGASIRPRWFTCSLTPASSACTPDRRPSLCWRPGAHHRREARVHRPGTGHGRVRRCWGDFLRDLKDRGLASPPLVVSDGAPGLIGANEQAFRRALRQRCLIHGCRNLLAKIPAGNAGRGQGRLLGHIRHRRSHHPAWAQARAGRRQPHRRLRRRVQGALPGDRQDPATRRPSRSCSPTGRA